MTESSDDAAQRDIELLESIGWEFRPVSLFDEEGVEGWIITEPDGTEHDPIIGVWDEPPELPEEAERQLSAEKMIRTIRQI